jgi:hypothetical protein
MPSRRYTEEQFRTALDDPEVRTMADLCRALGIVPRGANYETLRALGARLNVDLPTRDHQRQAFIEHVDDDVAFTEAVEASFSIADILRRFSGPISSASYKRVNRRIKELDLDTSHFRGQGHSRGRRYPERWKSTEELLEKANGSSKIRLALLRSGTRPHRCEGCGLCEWDGRPIPLELDHVDGDRTNNRLENLRLLCPNCHALTPTYRGRNIGTYDLPASTNDPKNTDGSPSP